MASKASGFLGLEVSCLPFCIITSLVFNHRFCLRSTGPQLFSSLLCSQFILKRLTWERPEKLHNDYFRNSVPGQTLPCWWSFRSLCCAFGLVHSPVTHLFLWAAAFSGSPDPSGTAVNAAEGSPRGGKDEGCVRPALLPLLLGPFMYFFL